MYYLKHYFNPNAAQNNLKPTENKNGGSDLYNLGFVQNVVPGMELVELVPIAAPGPQHEARFCIDQPVLPIGFNTCIDPSNPRLLISKASGYVFYLNDKVTVKNLLNIPHDVDFKTGNIFFVGDIVVHGSIRSGFDVHGGNIRISGTVEGANVRAHRNLLIEGGVWGGRNSGIVYSGEKMKMAFVDKGEVRAKDNIVITKSCLFSTVHAGVNLAVQGKLYGGVTNVHSSIYVGEHIGNKAEIPTEIHLGYEPFGMRQVKLLEKTIAEQSQTVKHLTAIAGHLPPNTNDNTRKLQELKADVASLSEKRRLLLERIEADTAAIASRCRLLCPGVIYPGVLITIGKIHKTVERPINNAQLRLVEEQIITEPMPAKPKAA